MGLDRRLVVGKHSGASGLIDRYREMGIAVSRTEAVSLMDQVRAIADVTAWISVPPGMKMPVWIV